MEHSRVPPRGAMTITASIACALFLAAFGWHLAVWQSPRTFTTNSTKTTSNIPSEYKEKDTDNNGIPDWEELFKNGSAGESAYDESVEPPLALSENDEILRGAGDSITTQLLGQYVALKQAGTYTPEAGARIGKSVSESMRYAPLFERYTKDSLTILEDASYEKTLEYRGNLREALAPLLQNTDAEFDIFARYIATGDETYLRSLGPIGERYKTAATLAGHVPTPKDAADTHVRMLNSLLQFASVLESITKWGSDPFASAVLLQTYNTAEREVFYAFDALATYYVQKTKNQKNI